MTKTNHAKSAGAHSEHRNLFSAEDRLDRWGATMGFLCAIHCIVTPFSLLFAPLFGIGALWTIEGEITILVLALICTLPSLSNAKKRNNSRYIISIFMLSWAILCGSFALKYVNLDDYLQPNHSHSSEHQVSHSSEHSHSPFSIALAVLGGIGLTTAHLVNLRQRRKAHQSCCSNEH